MLRYLLEKPKSYLPEIKSIIESGVELEKIDLYQLSLYAIYSNNITVAEYCIKFDLLNTDELVEKCKKYNSRDVFKIFSRDENFLDNVFDRLI
jgi:hypothetical protein